MKTITILIFTIILNSCGSAKETANISDTNSETKTEESKMVQDNIKIEYRAQARGSYKNIILENKTVSIQDNFNTKPTAKSCADKDWNTLTSKVSSLNLKSMSTLEAPSKAFQYDGAALTNFTITKDGTTYEVPPFDAGNPHKDIAPLVEMVLNIAKKSQEKN